MQDKEEPVTPFLGRNNHVPQGDANAPLFYPIMQRYRFHRVYNRFSRWKCIRLALHPEMIVTEAVHWPWDKRTMQEGSYGRSAGSSGVRHLRNVGDVLYDDPSWADFRDRCGQRDLRRHPSRNEYDHRRRHPVAHLLVRMNRWHFLKGALLLAVPTVSLWYLATNAADMHRQWIEYVEERERHKKFERHVQYMAKYKRVPPDFPIDRNLLQWNVDAGAEGDKVQDIDAVMKHKVAQVEMLRTLVERAEEYQLHQSRSTIEKMELQLEAWRKKAVERYNALLHRRELDQEQRQREERRSNPQLYQLKMQRRRRQKEELERIKLQALVSQYDELVQRQSNGDQSSEKAMAMIQEEIEKIESQQGAPQMSKQ